MLSYSGSGGSEAHSLPSFTPFRFLVDDVSRLCVALGRLLVVAGVFVVVVVLFVAGSLLAVLLGKRVWRVGRRLSGGALDQLLVLGSGLLVRLRLGD